MTDVGGVDVIKEFEVNSLNDVYLQGVTLSKKENCTFLHNLDTF